ncbi:MAG: hypothetical protein LBV34_19890 [Nocardiopsaceae bacterium]|nr:hypothetical protein [Nocardiopsaceae bacterium]
MPLPDMPHDRSLADNRDLSRAGDGRARSPAELLDNLRLRLSQLPESHPSALGVTYLGPEESGGRGRDGKFTPRPQPGSGRDRLREAAHYDDPRDSGAGDSGSRGYGPGDYGPRWEGRRDGGPQDGGQQDGADQNDGRPPGGGPLGDLIIAVREAGDALAGLAEDGALRDIDLYRGDFTDSAYSEPYRPWFMSGETGAPWFAEGG